MSEVFSVIHKEAEGGHVLELHGELDLVHAHLLDEAVPELEPQQILTLDLRPLQFMDSTGIRHLMSLNNRALTEGWRLQIVRGSKTIQRIFVLCGLDKHLPFVEER